MQLTSLFTLAVAGLASAALLETNSATTTLSSTTTLTQTITVTRCNSDVTSCPAWTTSTPVLEIEISTSTPAPEVEIYTSCSSGSAGWPEVNSASVVPAGPSGTGMGSQWGNSSSTTWVSTAQPTVSNWGSSSESATSAIAISGAPGGVFVQSGMMLGLLAAGVAILA